jgi:hypothetical protein
MYKKYKKTTFFIILGLLFTLIVFNQTAIALSLDEICSADVPVADNSNKTLQKGLSQALNQVLVKVSGNTSVMTLPAINNALPKINNYVQSYSYSAQTDNQGKQTLSLHVVFDDKAIRHILQNAGQAIWGDNRPLTLVWLAMPQGSQTTVLASDGNDALTTVVKQTAMMRGIPIIFPAMDLEDQADVAQTTSTLPTKEQLQQIAKKYGVTSLLAGTIVSVNSNHDTGDQAEGEWRLVLNGAPYEWQTTGADVSQVVINGIDRAADMMVNQLATIGGKNLQNTITMQINDVQNLNDYVHVVAELKKLTPVADVAVSDMSNNTLLLKVKTIGSVDELVSALKTSASFTAGTAPTTTSPANADLFYRWVTTNSNSN